MCKSAFLYVHKVSVSEIGVYIRIRATSSYDPRLPGEAAGVGKGGRVRGSLVSPESELSFEVISCAGSEYLSALVA